ncbi:hypothetical protein RUND412_000388 [Rhizina undulata]
MDQLSMFRLVNLGVGAIMVLGGIAQFFPVGIQNAVIGSYVIAFGLATALLEFQIPPQVPRYASFMFSFLGRGIFYIFVGSILLSGWWPRIIAGSLVGLVGLGYAALSFVPSVEPPENMRDINWDGEQV